MSNSAQDVLSVLHQLLLPTPNRNRLNIRQVRVWLNILSDALNLNETHKLLNVHFLSTPTTPWSGRYVALCVIRLSLVVNVCQTSGTRASFWLTVGLSPPPPHHHSHARKRLVYCKCFVLWHENVHRPFQYEKAVKIRNLLDYHIPGVVTVFLRP